MWQAVDEMAFFVMGNKAFPLASRIETENVSLWT